MSESSQELVKWIIVVAIVMSVFNNISGKTENTVYSNSNGKTYKTTIIVGENSATVFPSR